jgi:hypothetical protein
MLRLRRRVRHRDLAGPSTLSAPSIGLRRRADLDRGLAQKASNDLVPLVFFNQHEFSTLRVGALDSKYHD